MARFIINQKNTKNVIPGSPVFIGQQKQATIKITLIGYDVDNFVEIELQDIAQATNYFKKYKNCWINIDGLHDVECIKKIGIQFNLHTLIIEDIVHTGQRPKVEIDEDYIFTIIKKIFFDKEKRELDSEQISLYLTKNILLTFQEKQGDTFESIRDRIRTKKGRIRSSSIAYLKYCLLDLIVDNYNFLIEDFGNKIEDLEDKILLQPNASILQTINSYKFELNYFRKTIRPVYESFSNFKAFKTNLITIKEQPFFNDLNDLIQHTYDAVENYKNMLNDQLTVYSTNVNNRLNDIMKLLTIFSVVFIPITFIVGVYGTNFEYIPELTYKKGYFVMWGVIVFIAVFMAGYFKYKKWF
ncbi:magnesium/cobalt transporter CorA [Tenacibaculum sp. UWU-22]|uniref:magnesium/cobalt transporter CorA n=1 Tax=Tenacibaculum sp. UWU-22 TaxID=3234187 RepID=UPI0034DB14EE